ncbi:hypothetical protein EW15_1908 [Prochlorococcus sp. MIT 0801]|nr:hypothetical protein EW15_1908 [Prochlorococcus sp. MIT 0801]
MIARSCLKSRHLSSLQRPAESITRLASKQKKFINKIEKLANFIT